jgi:hypothetical protein
MQRSGQGFELGTGLVDHAVWFGVALMCALHRGNNRDSERPKTRSQRKDRPARMKRAQSFWK